MKEYELPYESFIGAWFIPESVCDNIVNHSIKRLKKAPLGLCGNNIDKKVETDIKDSRDMGIHPNHRDYPIGEYRKELQKVLELYLQKYQYAGNMARFDIVSDFNLQYYPPNGGFKQWHFERLDKSTSNRCLVFMTYMNDVEDGGTEFYYQNIKTPSKKGLTVIWPADWMHTHRGEISKSEKIIITGWYELIK